MMHLTQSPKKVPGPKSFSISEAGLFGYLHYNDNFTLGLVYICDGTLGLLAEKAILLCTILHLHGPNPCAFNFVEWYV